MVEAKEIQGTRCARFPNALHLEFHRIIYGYVSAVFAAENGPKMEDGLLAEYAGNIEQEVEMNFEPLVSADTAYMTGIDGERDMDLSYIFSEIRNAEKAPAANRRIAGAALKIATDRYRNIQNEAADEETAHIDGLLNDLKKTENAAHIATLGLTEDVKALEAKNKEYAEARLARTANRMESENETTRAIRRLTDQCYYLVCKYVEADYLLADTDEMKTALGDLIDKMNQTISEFKTTYAKMLAQRKPKNEDV